MMIGLHQLEHLIWPNLQLNDTPPCSFSNHRTIIITITPIIALNRVCPRKSKESEPRQVTRWTLIWITRTSTERLVMFSIRQHHMKPRHTVSWKQERALYRVDIRDHSWYVENYVNGMSSTSRSSGRTSHHVDWWCRKVFASIARLRNLGVL